ncbi:organic solute transporter Ostalpha-domain-containing protein [Tricladium varicosporioides]|nr:organic solute transporter Ostalpha-domain-containing protein [Hymenoscyphus varicosporioides]
MVSFNTTCNSTLEEMLIGSSEIAIVGNFTFHTIGLIVAAGCALLAILVSFYLIFMHATHYTKPYEQRHIIRILFMIPVYATSAFLSFRFYWHAVYFQVISDCYEAFAIASFFSLLCHYIAPNLHDQKQYFRTCEPKPWVWPLNWMKACCGGQRGIWRTPRSGLTWFNIIWTGVYQYCFIRVSMTITAVVTQYFSRYCESSNSPLFAHIWVLVLEGVAVTVAMYCLIQFYVQLRVDLAPHSPFLKVLAIKLVIFLSFWQSFAISILTSATFKVVQASSTIAYPDLKVGIPSLLLCIEMAIFAILHLFAFPYRPYTTGADHGKYPVNGSDQMSVNKLGSNQGGFMGIKALIDAMNPWDMVKGFARGMRWLFVGRKHRQNDSSYKKNVPNENDMALDGARAEGYKVREEIHLPIANEFRRSRFGMPTVGGPNKQAEEGAGLIAHAQPNPLNPSSGYTPARERYDAEGRDIGTEPLRYDGVRYTDTSPERFTSRNPGPRNQQSNIGMAVDMEPEAYQSRVPHLPYPQPTQSESYLEQKREGRRQQSPSQQWASSSQPTGDVPEAHNALWGQKPMPRDDGRF